VPIRKTGVPADHTVVTGHAKRQISTPGVTQIDRVTHTVAPGTTQKCAVGVLGRLLKCSHRCGAAAIRPNNLFTYADGVFELQ